MEVAETRRRSWGRILAGGVAMATLLFAARSFWLAVTWERQVRAAETAEPIRLPVNLSKPGTYSGTLRHTFGAGSVELHIVAQPPQRSEYDPKAAVEGLSGHWAIVGSDGTVVMKREFGPQDLQRGRWEPEGWVAGIGSDRFEPGDYELHLTVERGAAGLANVPQTLAAGYLLCGMEYAGKLTMYATAVGSLAIGAIIALVILTVTERRCRRRTPKTGCAKNGHAA
jgi:hypothetical protein